MLLLERGIFIDNFAKNLNYNLKKEMTFIKMRRLEGFI